MKPKILIAVFLFATALTALPVSADAPSFNVAGVTPVGSWAEREQVSIDNRGRKTVAIMRQKLIDKTAIDGETHYWIETETSSYKINKKGVRKQQGDVVVMKVLVAESTLNGDPGNIVNNLSSFGKEIIMQTGQAQPIRIREGGMMAGFMMKAMGVKVDYQFARVGSEKVSVPAGEFRAEKFTGSGAVDTTVLFKKMSVQSESEFWLTPEIPFGFARMLSQETLNGKPQSSEAYVTSFGMSGATSAITGEPTDLMGGGEGGFNLKDMIPGGG